MFSDQASPNGAHCRLLPTNNQPTASAPQQHKRYHLQHGPIDIVADFFGSAHLIDQAIDVVWKKFQTILAELAWQLPLLRSGIVNDVCSTEGLLLVGDTAQRMVRAVQPFSKDFITPMAAVAGSVADTLLATIDQLALDKVIINNGGDIATRARLGQIINVQLLAPCGVVRLVGLGQEQYGVATSGWSGRSFSFGVADAVTVVAKSAGAADAAATMIANQVGDVCDHPAISRSPANTIKDDTDLGDRLVTTAVGRLPQNLIRQLLANGAGFAEDCLRSGKILAASLFLQGESVIVARATNPFVLRHTVLKNTVLKNAVLKNTVLPTDKT